MQKKATKVFICASVAFGVLGIIALWTSAERDADNSAFTKLVMKLMITTVFIILPSLALSIAGKYLKDK